MTEYEAWHLEIWTAVSNPQCVCYCWPFGIFTFCQSLTNAGNQNSCNLPFQNSISSTWGFSISFKLQPIFNNQSLHLALQFCSCWLLILCSLPSPVLSDSHIPVSLPSSSSPIHLLWQREQGGSKSSPLAQPSGNTVWLFQEWARVTASTSSPAKPLPAPGLSTSLPSAENSAGDSAILWLIFSISDWLNKIWRMISFHWATATEGWKCCEAGSLCERQHLSPRLKTWMCVIK